jgi:hypothetical protein
MTDRVTWGKYVRHHEIEEYARRGFEIKELGRPHDVWSALAIWEGVTDPPWPMELPPD